MKSYFFLILFIFLSCKQRENNNYILTDFTKATDSLSVDRMGYELKYIPLEMNDSSVISTIQKMEAAGEYIFIESGAVLLQFDTAGKFIREISSVGRGPDEHTGLSDFSIDFQNGIVYLTDVKQVLAFGTDGRYIGKSAADLCWKFMAPGNGQFLLHPFNMFGNAPYKLVVRNNKADTLARFKNYLQYTPKQGYTGLRQVHSVFTRNGNEIIFRQQYSDTVFTYDPAGLTLTPRYIFDFENERLSLEALADDANTFKKVTYIAELYDRPDYIHVVISRRNDYQYFIIDKNDQKIYRSALRLEPEKIGKELSEALTGGNLQCTAGDSTEPGKVYQNTGNENRSSATANAGNSFDKMKNEENDLRRKENGNENDNENRNGNENGNGNGNGKAFRYFLPRAVYGDTGLIGFIPPRNENENYTAVILRRKK